jgi:hypothetical protein
VEALGEGGVQGGQGHRYIPVCPARSSIKKDCVTRLLKIFQKRAWGGATFLKKFRKRSG